MLTVFRLTLEQGFLDPISLEKLVQVMPTLDEPRYWRMALLHWTQLTKSVDYVRLGKGWVAFLTRSTQKMNGYEEYFWQMVGADPVWLQVIQSQCAGLPQTRQVNLGLLGGHEEMKKGENEIKHISFRNQQLERLPDGLGAFPLESLDLYKNHLKCLPSTLGCLDKLKVLELAHHQLETLPDSIGALGCLEKLNLYNNQLQQLPETMGQLKRLQVLYLHRNQLTHLPSSLVKLECLREWRLDANPLSNLPRGIDQMNLQSLYIDKCLKNKFRYNTQWTVVTYL